MNDENDGFKTVVVILIVLAFIACDVWFVMTYGDKPVSELPAWVWWLFGK